MIAGILFSLGLVFFTANGLTRSLSSWASGRHFLDYPNERSLHVKPLPRVGGLAILGSVLGGGIFNLAVGTGAALQVDACVWILSMVLLIGAVSFLDDRVGLPPVLRLGAHALAAVGIVWGAGVNIRIISFPGIGSLALERFAVPLTVLFIVWMANLYNFMDGMDGLAGGMALLGHGFVGYVAWRGGHQVMLISSLLIVAAAGGFLWYNLPPARIFMGDVGSIPLGFLAGTMAVLGVHDGLFDIWVPLLIFSPFVVDTTVTLFHRLLRGEKIWLAHREHYYQRLVLAGWGHRKTMVAEYLLMLACGLSGVLYAEASDLWRSAILAGWVMGYLGLAWGVRMVERQSRGLKIAW